MQKWFQQIEIHRSVFVGFHILNICMWVCLASALAIGLDVCNVRSNIKPWEGHYPHVFLISFCNMLNITWHLQCMKLGWSQKTHVFSMVSWYGVPPFLITMTHAHVHLFLSTPYDNFSCVQNSFHVQCIACVF